MARYDVRSLYEETFGPAVSAPAPGADSPPIPEKKYNVHDLYARTFGQPRTEYQDLAPAVNRWAAGAQVDDPERADKVHKALRAYLGENTPPVGLLTLQQAEERLRVAQMDHATQGAPYTAKWAVQRAGENRAPYDLPGLAKVEKSYGELLKDFLSKPAAGTGDTVKLDTTSPLYFYVAGPGAGIEYARAAAPEAFKRVVQAAPSDIFAVGPLNLLSGLQGAYTAFLENSIPAKLLNTLATAITGTNALAEHHKLGDAARHLAEDIADSIPEDASLTERGFRSGFQSMGQTLPLLLSAPLAGKGAINAFSGAMGASVGGQTYLRNYEKYQDPQRAALHGLLDGAAEYVFERLGGEAVLLDKAAWAKGFFGGLAKFIAREVPSEMATTFVQNVDDWALMNPDKSVEKFLAEQGDAQIETIIATLVGGGGQIAVVKGLEAAAAVVGGSGQAGQEERQLADLFSASTDARLFNADPEAFDAFMQGIAPDASVRIDATVLSQAMESAGVDASAMPSVLEQGDLPGEIEVPIAELIRTFAGTPAEADVIQNLRLDPEAQTIKERRDLGDRALDEFKRIGSKTLEAKKADDRFTGSLSALREEIQADLEATGAYKPGATSAFAEAVSLTYATTAARMGVTPIQLRDGWTDAKGVEHRGYNLLAASEGAGKVRRAAPPATKADFAPGRVQNILRRGNWAVVTAENPKGVEISPEENAARQLMLKAELDKRGLRYEQIEGKYVEEGKEETAPLGHPFLILGIDLDTARELGNKFEQDSVLSKDGVVYSDGTVHRATSVTEHDIEPKNYWIRVPSTGAMFTANLDFSEKVPLSETSAVEDEVANAIEPQGGALYQKVDFFSPLARAFETAKQEAMPAGQWAAWLNGNKSKLGLKDDELNFSGILDYLELRGKDKVTKAEIADYLSGNGVKVETVEKGQRTSTFKNMPPEDKDTVREILRRYDYLGFDTATEALRAYTEDPNAWDMDAEDRATLAPILGADVGLSPAKFSGYWDSSYKDGIPGTYREILVTLPVDSGKALRKVRERITARLGRDDWQWPDLTEQETDDLNAAFAEQDRGAAGFRSGHWDEPNVLVHIRTDEVMGADGKRYLRVGEVQSDWGQEGKKKGFGTQVTGETIQGPMVPGAPTGPAPVVRVGVPEAPFVTDTKAWVALGVKQAIRQAIESGVDGIVFGTGEQNANLYDLSKRVDAVNYDPDNQRLVAVQGRQRVIDETGIPPERLEEYVGGEVAQKLIDSPKNGAGNHELSGLDLKVGGEGMRAFYDKIVPQVANDVLRKLGGGKVAPTEIAGGELKWWRETNGFTFGPFDSKKEAEGQGKVYQEAGEVTQPGFEIPDTMREALAARGMPLFQNQPGTSAYDAYKAWAEEGKNPQARGTFSPERLEYTLLAKADLSTFMHEMGHFYLTMQADLALQIEQRVAAGEEISAGEQSILDDMNTVLEWMGVTASTPAEGATGGVLGQSAGIMELPKPSIPEKLSQKRFESILQDFDTGGYAFTEEDEKQYFNDVFRPVIKELRAAGVTHVDMYHVTDAGYSDFKQDGIRGSSVSSIGRVGGNVRKASVYGFLDPDDIAKGYDGVLGAESETPNVMHIKVPLDEIGRFKWDSNYNVTYGTYSGIRFVGDVPSSWIAGEYQYDVSKNEVVGARNGEKLDAMRKAALAQNGAHPQAPGPLPAGTSALEVWSKMSLEQQRPFHEKYAETFEQYLLTGKAPTKKLESLFRRLADWMRRVYLDMKRFLQQRNLADLNPEISAVFDRLVATEQEITEAIAQREHEALFKSAVEAGMTPEQYAKYIGLSDDAKLEAEAQLRARAMRDMKWMQNRRNKTLAALQADAKEKRAAAKAEVRAEVEQEPIFQAIRWLRHGIMVNPDTKEEIQALKGHKLHAAAVAEMFPEGAIEGAPDWKKLGYGKYGMLAAEGIHPDMLAEMFGFRSGRALVEALLNAPSIRDEIEGLTDQRMLERYGDLATPEGIARAADEAMVNDVRLRMLATELSGLAAHLGSPAAIMRAAKAYAKVLVDSRVVKKLKPRAYSADATRAGKQATAAWAKGDAEQAAGFKRTEILNHVTAAEAYEAEKEIKKITDRLTKIANVKDDDSAAKSRNMDVVNATRVVLASFGFGNVKKGESAKQYLDALKGIEPEIGAAMEELVMLSTSDAKNWRNLTVAELRDLHGLVSGVWSLAKRSREIEIDGKRMLRETVVDELVARAQAHDPSPAKNTGARHAITAGEERRNLFSTLKAQFRRVSDWAEAIDGGKTIGPFRRYVWLPIKDAADRYRADKVKYLKAYHELIKPLSNEFGKGLIDAPEIGYVFGKGDGVGGMNELLHAILHTGNGSNKRKLLLGRGWATENEDGSLDTGKWDKFITRMHREGVLQKRHYDFAQGVWDLLESTKINAQKAHRAVFGKSFAEVTADSFITPFGTYAGGYVPAMADSRIVQDAQLRALANQENENMAYAMPTPARGFTMSRVEYNRPLLLDLRTLAGHIDKVLLFSHLAEPAADVRRILMDKRVSAEINRIDSAALTSMLTPWLSRAAKQVVEVKKPGAEQLGRFWSAARSRAGMAAMFANVVNTAQQITGFSTAAVKVGPGYLLRANAKYLANPADATKFVTENSLYISERIQQGSMAMSGEVNEILINPNVYQSAAEWTRRHAYFTQTAIDGVMSPIIWLGAYQQALDNGASHQDAARLGDESVRQTQGSQMPEEVANFEVGSPFYRMFTQFAGYFNAQANMLGTEFSKVAHEMGLRKGLGRGFYVLVLGMLAPAIVSEMIVQAFRGGPDDEDKDGEYLDDWISAVFVGTARYMVAMFPGIGPSVMAMVNTFNHKPYDDRISTAPAISMVETAVRAPISVYKAWAEDETGKPGKAIADTATAVSMLVGVPVRAIVKPIAYAADVEAGNIEPTGGMDYTRGLITGTASPESKQ